VEFKHPPDDHGNECLLHLNPVAGHVAIEAVFAVQRIHVGIPGPGALMEPPGHIEFFMQTVERLPVIRVPEVAIHEIGAHKGAHGPEFFDAAH
jgi:hypothetical protein